MASKKSVDVFVENRINQELISSFCRMITIPEEKLGTIRACWAEFVT